MHIEQEFEYEIPQRNGLELFSAICLAPIISKTRYRIPQGKGRGQ